jgi:MYXO-CTERM domain-containing protein
VRGIEIGLLIALAALGWTQAVQAQSFPPDREWRPLYCGEEVMSDLIRDEPDAIDERDLVGDLDFDEATGLRAADDDFFYLRLRLDEDAILGDELLPFAWGVAFDLDLDPTTYEVLVLADGITGEVNLFENTEITIDNDPTDPADEPPVASYLFADAGQVIEAGSDIDGDADFFIDLAVPWADLETVGLAPDSELHLWAASSESQNRLDGDFACHDGSSGAPSLDESASDRTVADPRHDSDGDGSPDADEIAEGTDPDDPDDFPEDDPGDPGERRLEGGQGCAASGGAAPWPVALFVLALLAAHARRPRRGRFSRHQRAWRSASRTARGASSSFTGWSEASPRAPLR